jgi:hypothetical protein
MRSKLLNLTNEVDELFYWSPSSAKILAKQAHLVKRHVTANPVTFQYFKSIGLSDLHVEKYYDLIKPAIYPNTYDPALLQCNKAKPIYTERDWWFYEEDNRSFKVWEDGLGLIQSVIDPYWFNKGTIRDGINGSPSKFYKFSGT